MKNKLNKDAVLQACIAKQQELIDNYSNEINKRNEDAFKRSESASQSDNRSGTKLDVLAAMSEELVFAKKEMAYLESLDVESEKETVGPGAIVVTNYMTFFIGVSSEKVEVDGETVFGISTRAPLYQEMKDLKKGDIFQFNDRKYEIEDLY